MRVQYQPSERRPTKLFEAIQRPEYLYRPTQIWRRLRKNSVYARKAVQLAWGLPIEIGPVSHVGVDVLNLGVHDRVVAEAICRLLDPGEDAIDIGANIGQNTSMMALVAGSRGRVIAFEPSPISWDLLTRNVGSWSPYDMAPITLVRKGVSSQIGGGLLHQSVDLGGFSMEDSAPGPPRITPEGSQGIKIELTTLDAFVSQFTKIGLVKIDVEGHELSVLGGATRILEQKLVRDIVFEDFHPQPSPVTARLQTAGYEVFGLFQAWLRPSLLPLNISKPYLTNFLATRDPDRARARFEAAGWRCLRLRAQRKVK
jgi:FkbM family methyltransferase